MLTEHYLQNDTRNSDDDEAKEVAYAAFNLFISEHTATNVSNEDFNSYLDRVTLEILDRVTQDTKLRTSQVVKASDFLKEFIRKYMNKNSK